MVREYLEQDVYEALKARLKLIFEEFDNIYVSFSGGKDSGLLLNLTLEFQKTYYPNKKVGVFHQDFEAQYTMTTEYVERTFEKIKNENILKNIFMKVEFYFKTRITLPLLLTAIVWYIYKMYFL